MSPGLPPGTLTFRAAEAFTVAWNSFGPGPEHTSHEIERFLSACWAMLDPGTRGWIANMPDTWTELQNVWPTLSAPTRQQTSSSWKEFFNVAETCLQTYANVPLGGTGPLYFQQLTNNWTLDVPNPNT
jgi:hypothetical protein